MRSLRIKERACFSWVFHSSGILPLAAVLFITGVGVPAVGDTRYANRQCVREMHPLLTGMPVTRLPEPPPKVEKEYPAPLVVSKRKGPEPLIATLYNVHTRESLPVFEHSRLPLAAVREFFRCRGFGITVDMDPRLLDALMKAAIHFKTVRIEMISGFRSPKFNDCLAKKGRRVATESRHTKGQAIDFRLVGTPASRVGPWLIENFEGGVGTYRTDDFVHIDVGARRRWEGH